MADLAIACLIGHPPRPHRRLLALHRQPRVLLCDFTDGAATTMSYDLFIEAPKGQRSKPKRGEYPAEAIARMTLAAELLAQFDSELSWQREDAQMYSESSRLGTVALTPNRLALRFSSASDYGQLLRTFRDTLHALAPLGWQGSDPQVGTSIHWHADVPTFLQQFREQFLCPDDEFAEWAQGREPAAWARWRELQARHAAGWSLAAFPPIVDFPNWQSERDLSTPVLGALLDRLIGLNDARIAKLGLADYLAQALLRGAYPMRRGNGAYIPDSDWILRSSLGQEMGLLATLRVRGWPAVIFPQPQQLSIIADANAHSDPAAYDKRAEAMMRAVFAALKTRQPQLRYGSSWANFVRSTLITCTDVDAMSASLRDVLLPYADLNLQVVRRYGDIGAREEIERPQA